MNITLRLVFCFAISLLAGCQTASSSSDNDDDANITAPKLRDDFIRGVDISMLPEIEALGGKYYHQSVEQDLFTILKKHGVNAIRTRLWIDPKSNTGESYGGGNNQLTRSIDLAKRAKDNGMTFLLDLHYSDFWADPKKQSKPKAWQHLSFENLNQKVYDYTAQVMQAYQAAGVVPDSVQIGNEINGGMLWPDGKNWGPGSQGFEKLSLLLKAGIQAVHDNSGEQDTQIILHLAEAGKNEYFRWWFDEIHQYGVEYDIIGMSYYPWWHGPIADVKANMEDLSNRYNKPILLVETSFPYTNANADRLENSYSDSGPIQGYQVSVNGQAQFLSDIMLLLNNLPNQQGLGIYYWEPAWLPVEGATWATKAGMAYGSDQWQMGNAWENQGLFDFGGNALPSLEIFKTQK
ncbi:glycoside hydrolase family 53 protein [Agarivorans litoreus]|uniref:glycoside hydrolase family 53 protein n=1 Tax=Agarivorans litoreus TaxID=1510455 RepID=UPI001C7DBAE8|nr:glycosyl hydrolase 53 family protein [Agarivorans litoreus]